MIRNEHQLQHAAFLMGHAQYTLSHTLCCSLKSTCKVVLCGLYGNFILKCSQLLYISAALLTSPVEPVLQHADIYHSS